MKQANHMTDISCCSHGCEIPKKYSFVYLHLSCNCNWPWLLANQTNSTKTFSRLNQKGGFSNLFFVRHSSSNYRIDMSIISYLTCMSMPKSTIVTKESNVIYIFGFCHRKVLKVTLSPKQQVVPENIA